MPISVKQDVKPIYGFGSRFKLGDTPIGPPHLPPTIQQVGGKYLEYVRGPVADQNWAEFLNAWDLVGLSGSKTKREILKAIARKYNMLASEEATFDDLWEIASDADEFKKSSKKKIEEDLATAYKHAAKLADGGDVDKRTFSRVVERHGERYVVFSDHHMTDFANKPNFFGDFNERLYLAVLEHYASETDFTLVENGDVEECVIYEPTPKDAATRARQAPGKSAFPIVGNEKWAEFLDTRYEQRNDNLDLIFKRFGGYYELVREGFVDRKRYVRLTGNHDTYLDDGPRERALMERIETKLGIEVHDVCRIARKKRPVEYLIMHGHQFDSVSTQHGETPWAKSLGEVYSECLSWGFEGPDRFWPEADSKKWFIGGQPYTNVLAVEEPEEYQGEAVFEGVLGDGGWDLVNNEADRIKEDTRGFLESLLDVEIAWEYFENSNAFEALMLEIWTGDELYKARHMDEVSLCNDYQAEFVKRSSEPVPALVLGHTHEPRHQAVTPGTARRAPWYLNSGSAGRYQNLIWCVEILEDEHRICSWSNVNERLRKIVWKPEIDEHEKSVLVHLDMTDEGPV
ncbi:MAG: hypothetical protein M3340_04320 [Actinomycetota bacterium]|nr:hypothetical protein [Actinomycetota bacterium]